MVFVNRGSEKMKVTIDRFEGEYAVCEIEKGRFLNIPAELVPGAREGDIVSIEILREESDTKKEKLKSRLNGLFN